MDNRPSYINNNLKMKMKCSSLLSKISKQNLHQAIHTRRAVFRQDQGPRIPRNSIPISINRKMKRYKLRGIIKNSSQTEE